MDFLKRADQMKKKKDKSDKTAGDNLDESMEKGDEAYSDTDSFMKSQNKRIKKLGKRQDKLDKKL